MPVDPYTYVDRQAGEPSAPGGGGSDPGAGHTSVHHVCYHVEWRNGDHAWRVRVGDTGTLQLQRSNTATAPNEWQTRIQHS